MISISLTLFQILDSTIIKMKTDRRTQTQFPGTSSTENISAKKHKNLKNLKSGKLNNNIKT